MKSRYHLEGGQYVLKVEETGEVLARMSEVSLLINKHTGVLVAHGKYSFVCAQDYKMLTRVHGKIPVDILNRCLDEDGYAAKFFAGWRGNDSE
jgi:hypothetical protein